MTRARTSALAGPALVLYLVAHAVATGGGLDPIGACVGALAVLAASASLFGRRREAFIGLRETATGARRVALLGVATGVTLVDFVDPGALSLSLGIATAFAASLAGALVVDLALSAPDRPRALDRGAALTAAPYAAGLLACLTGIVALLPAWSEGGRDPWLLPAALEDVPRGFAVASLFVALALRLARRRLGTLPEELASSAWAVLGLVPALVALVAAWALSAGDTTSPWVRALVAASGASVVAGHLLMIDARRRLAAGLAVRRVTAAVVTFALVAAVVGAARSLLPSDPIALAVAAAATLVAAACVHRVASLMVKRLLAPAGGALLDAVDAGIDRLAGATSFEDVGRAVLGPLRRAAAAFDADPVLFAVVPPREVRVDAAGEPHASATPMSDAITERLLDHPGEIIVRAQLEALVVRRPNLRPVVEALAALDALCVVPLIIEGELEGSIVVPRGARSGTVTLEEMAALERLARYVGGFVSVLSARARALERAGVSALTHDRAEERIERLEEELTRLRSDSRVLKAGSAADRLAAPPIAYSAIMRGLVRRIGDIAPLDAPVLLVAEGGTNFEQLASLVHARSGRADGPLVVAHCGSIRPERSAAALFGEEGGEVGAHPGWLRLAAGGSLLLVDIPALSVDAQRVLAEAVSTRQARPVGGAGAYPIEARIVATSRVALARLVEAGSFDAELCQWLSPLSIEIPSLRERREDLPSLVLLALDRAARVLGREPIGIEQPALDALLTHDWPGNLGELQSVVDRAAVRAVGSKVRLSDLPPLVPGSYPDVRVHVEIAHEDDPFVGTYETLERSILKRALERASGNKSEAARMLGLKRTTFLDKLRRYRLDDTGREMPRETTPPPDDTARDRIEAQSEDAA